MVRKWTPQSWIMSSASVCGWSGRAGAREAKALKARLIGTRKSQPATKKRNCEPKLQVTATMTMADENDAGPSSIPQTHEGTHQERTADAAPASGFTYVQRNKRLHGRRVRGKKNGAGQPSGEREGDSQPSIEQLLDVIRSKKQALSQGQYGAALEECIDAFARARCDASLPRPSAASDHTASAQVASTSTSPGPNASVEGKALNASSSRSIPDRIVALGMGRVSQSRSAQIQLALLLIMADLFEVRDDIDRDANNSHD